MHLTTNLSYFLISSESISWKLEISNKHLWNTSQTKSPPVLLPISTFKSCLNDSILSARFINPTNILSDFGLILVSVLYLDFIPYTREFNKISKSTQECYVFVSI